MAREGVSEEVIALKKAAHYQRNILGPQGTNEL